MTAHTHRVYVDGCFRCELSKDEAEDARQEQAADLDTAADETNDAYDHDELHAAADIVRLNVHSVYIDRWIARLEERIEG